MTKSKNPKLKIISDNKKDKKRVEKLISTLCESDRGKEILKFAEKKKIKIVTTKGCDETGYYDSDKKQVVLATDYYDKSFALFTLAHELKHAKQYEKIDYDDSHLNIKSQTMLMRATEADAMAFCHLCALELKEKGLGKYFDEVKKDLKEISKPMEKAYKENPKDYKKIMLAGFNGWYKNKFSLIKINFH